MTSRHDPAAALQEELEAHRRRLRKAVAGADDEAFMTLFLELQRWLADQPDDHCLAALEERGYVARHLEFFAGCQRRYLKAQEERETRSLLSRRTSGASFCDALESAHEKHAYRRVAEALRLVDFSTCRRFVMVGCGPLPAAVMYVHDHTPTPEIVALDNDAHVVGLARQVAAMFAPERVRVLECDGRDFDYRGADIVYVANHVGQKSAVLARIADTADSAAHAIVRDPFGYGKLFAESGVAKLDPRLCVARAGEDNRRFSSKHFLLGWRPGRDPG